MRQVFCGKHGQWKLETLEKDISSVFAHHLFKQALAQKERKKITADTWIQPL